MIKKKHENKFCLPWKCVMMNLTDMKWPLLYKYLFLFTIWTRLFSFPSSLNKQDIFRAKMILRRIYTVIQDHLWDESATSHHSSKWPTALQRQFETFYCRSKCIFQLQNNIFSFTFTFCKITFIRVFYSLQNTKRNKKKITRPDDYRAS